LAYPGLLLVGLLLAALGGACSAGAGGPSSRSAKELFKRGRQFEKKGNLAQAYVLYSQAAAANPGKRQYWQRAQALQTKAALEANVMPAGAASTGAEAEPGPPLPDASPEELNEARKPQPPVELSAAPGTQDFDLRADTKALWEAVTKAYGLDVIFDGDYQPGAVARFRISGADYREALHALMSATSSFIVPISPRLVLVVKDTEPKRREVENTVAVTVPILEPITVQEAQEMARSVQQLMEIQHFAIDSGQRLVLMRDRVSKVVPAQAILQQLLQKRAQIVIEVELVAVPKRTSLRYGLGLMTSFPIVPLIKTIALAGGPLSFGLTLGSAEVLAEWSKSTATSIFRAEMRSLDGMPATFHAGEKYPIVTVSYVGEVDPNQQVFVPPPTFNFEDLGLGLKITPRVHDREEVTLEVEAEYKLLGNATFNGNPIISNRKFMNRVRLRFDEWAIVAGLVSDSRASTLSGLAGVSSIPVIGTVLGRTTKTREQDETLLVLKPRLVTAPPTESIPRPIWIGAESRLRTPM
jgi:general secretion pathway protein D